MTPEEIEQLKPCPFCGGEPEIISVCGETWIKCKDCSSGAEMHTEACKAVTRWNTRPEENRLKELAKAAHASLSAQVRIWEERAFQAGYVLVVEPAPAASLAPEWEPDGDYSEVD